METEIAVSVDARGLSCPLPVVRAKKAIDSIAVGAIMEVVSTDSGSMADFKAWTRATGHELVRADDAGGVYTYLIRRTK